MNVLIDMNLSPDWCEVLTKAGHEATHWSRAGEPGAPDSVILSYAQQRAMVVFTHDLGFSALLAAALASGPSVIQIRTPDPTPTVSGPAILAALTQFAAELASGAVVVIDPAGARARLLPFK